MEGSPKDPCLWLMVEKEGDRVWNTSFIVVDVTPEKRYAVWNHIQQRFVNNGNHPTAHGFRTKQEAEIYLQDHFQTQKKLVYVVEWEIKSDD